MATFNGVARRSRVLVLTIVTLVIVSVWFLSPTNLHVTQTDAPTVSSRVAKHQQVTVTTATIPSVTKRLFRNILARPTSTDNEDFIKELNMLNEERAAADDPRLIRIIKEYFIVPPSTKPYNLTNPYKREYSGQGKDFIVPNTLKNLPDVGFFIECGAYNGEYLSTSLYFEKQKHWSGLLIEANPELFADLLTKHRKAYSLNACLNMKPYPSVMRFNLNDVISRLVEDDLKEAYSYHHGFGIVDNTVDIQCFPLYSVLLAMGRTTVDFMSLDTEGTEFSILKTVPWDKVDIRTMLVEHSHQPGKFRPQLKYMESKGYTMIKLVHEDSLLQKKVVT